ncbi:MAG: hypothetical protein WC100_17880 [Sterolibacterium sp.]
MLTNAEVREALKGSIAKWTAIGKGTSTDEDIMDNPLCRLFYGTYATRCNGCPVKEYTGAAYCANSAYADWCNNCSAASRETKMAVTAKDKKLARAERDFLIGLDTYYFKES